MKLHTLINNKVGEPVVCLIGAKSAVGKTSLQIILASETAKEGKNVLFLTSEHPKNITKRFSILLDANDKSIGKVHISKLYLNFEREITLLMKNRSIDAIFIDDLHFFDKVTLRSMMYFFKSLNISIYIGVQLMYRVSNSYGEGLNPTLLDTADSVLVIDKKTEFTLLEEIKNILMFWKPKPNRTIKYLKNRKGDNLDKDIFLNFKNLTIN